ncbi:MAG: glycosyltransferase [Clostridiales bacterium]|nr:glycosyltransferase [Clostridiales bacterium]
MKKILIVIYNMHIGGAQKSLLSFLQSLAADGRQDQYDVHVLALNPEGEFLSQIPAGIHVDKPANVLRWMGGKLKAGLALHHFSLRGVIGELRWLMDRWLRGKKQPQNDAQRLWQVWGPVVPQCKEHYDVAISYIDGTTSYYVMDKVAADKKVLWLHSDYRKQEYDPAFDDPYYQACDIIVTVSAECRESIRQALPQHGEKMHVLENISSFQAVEAASREGSCPEYRDAQGLKLLSVGRLHEQKGMDIAVEAAKHLKESGTRFCWLVVGEGSERRRLEEMIEAYGLTDCFRLIGARQNPYIYMRECDILVQPSRIEGKSIALDETKMLLKPIVATRYPTVGDAITHGVTGWVTDMNGEALSQGIVQVAQDEELRMRLVAALEQLPKGNEEELQKYIELMF